MLFISCTPKAKDDAQSETQDVVRFDSDDEEMNRAIAVSRDSFNQFEEAFESVNTNLNTFAVKVKFSDMVGGSEHIWIVDIVKQADGYYGNVGNEPESTIEVSIGEHIKIDKNKISDWMYLENNVLRGGNTLRLIRKRMSPEEQKQFDQQVGFIIED